MKHRNISPLRYPGGKAKLSKFLIEIIDSNNLKGCTYIEPFAGGAGAALSLLFNGYVNNIIINDYDPAIYSFWCSILFETEEFCHRIKTTDISIKQWYKQKELINTATNHLDRGFAAFFLNRTNRSGIIKGGVIGGINQLGKYKLNCRFNKNNLVERIQNIAKFKNSIKVTGMDASKFITDYLISCPSNSFIYLDPPYFLKGPGLYTNYYTQSDHEYLAKLIKTKIKQPWLLTYDYAPEIKMLYSELQYKKYHINYSANKNYKGVELLVFSDKLTNIDSKQLTYFV